MHFLPLPSLLLLFPLLYITNASIHFPSSPSITLSTRPASFGPDQPPKTILQVHVFGLGCTHAPRAEIAHHEIPRGKESEVNKNSAEEERAEEEENNRFEEEIPTLKAKQEIGKETRTENYNKDDGDETKIGIVAIMKRGGCYFGTVF